MTASAPRIRDATIALVAASLAGYVAVRAVRIPIVHDEALSYLSFTGRSFAAIFSPRTPLAVNNHLLNSLLSRVCALAFGPSEWALRLPNVLSFGLYLGCGAALCRRFSSPLAAVAGFLLFSANPFLLEFFSLARGYGLALAFLAAALLLFVKAGETPAAAPRALLAGGICGFLSGLANLTFLLPVFALFGVAALRARRDLRALAPSFAVPLLLIGGLLGPWVLVLAAEGQFFTGGRVGFFADTAGSLVEATAAPSGPGSAGFAVTAAVAAALLALGLAGALLPSTAGGRSAARVAVPVLLVSAGVSASQHVLFGTPYLQDRTAILFVPLLGLGAGAGLDVLASASRPAVRRLGLSLAAGVTALAALPLVRSANVDHTTVWRYDADGRRVVDELAAIHEEGLGRIRIGGTWLYEPALNFYRVTRRLEWLEPVVRRDSLDRCNVVLMSPDEPVALPSGEFAERRTYPLSRSALLVRVRPPGAGARRGDSR